MRLLFALGLVIASAVPSFASPPDHSTTPARVVSWRPHAWHPPASTAPVGAGLRIEPDAGVPTPADDVLQAQAARREALARVPVITRPDGSRSAVLGGLIRAYTVARIGPDGRLVQECVHSETEARQAIAPAASKER